MVPLPMWSDAIVTVGTLLGSRALRWIPEVWFRRVLALILALLGGAMLVRGIQP